MANESPVSVLFSRDGYDVVTTDGYSIATEQPGIIAAGKDGSTARFIAVNSSGAIKIDGSAVTQPISASSLPLPTGAATEATLSTRLADSTFTARINTLGQKTAANSTPVVLASDQTVIPISDNSGSITIDTTQLPAALVGGRLDTNNGAWLGSTAPTVGQKTMTNSIPVVVASNQSALAVSQSGTWTVQPGNTANTTPWLITISQGGNAAAVTASNALKVDGSAVTQPVSGTVTSNQGTAASLANAWPIKISDGTNTVPLTNAAPVGNEQGLVVRNIPSGTQTISGSVKATVSGTVTANQGTAQSLSNPWPVQLSNGTNTPIITNTTPGASDQALVVRNIPSGTQTVSGTVAATQSGAWTVTANAGTGTFSIAGIGTAGTPSGGILTVQGASGTTPLSMGGTTATSAPSWGDAQLRPLSLTLSGRLRVDGSEVTQPISASSLPLPTGAATESTLAGVLTTSAFQARINTLGQKTMANSTPVVFASDQSVIPVSDNGGSLTIDNSTLSVTGGGTEASALRVTIANNSSGVLSVDDNGGSLTVDGTVTSNQGTPNSTANAWPITVTDGTTTATVKQASAAAVSSDTALVVAISPNTVAFVKDAEYATFAVVAANIAQANNKSMVSILNAGRSSVVIKIRELHLRNSQVSAVTGVAGNFEFRRFTGHSGGTLITPVTYDTNDVISGSVTARTGASITGEGDLLARWKWSTDDWGPGKLDQEGLDHTMQSLLPIWKYVPPGKGITLRAGQGIHLKFATNSNKGSWDMRVVFTQE